jgi:probable F420-dependent oxidoreductase
MRLGLLPPFLHVPPRYNIGWENNPRLDTLIDAVIAADKLGYDHVIAPEHYAVHQSMEYSHGGLYFHPAISLGAFAAVTTQIRLGPSVLNLSLHHPLEVVKCYGTLDFLSRGRLLLGVGVGSRRAEFDLFGAGAPFEERGQLVDDSIRAIRAGFANERPSYSGKYFQFADIILAPNALRDVPIWVGGSSQRSLRRAIELGDVWHPAHLDPATISERLSAGWSTRAWELRDKPLAVIPRMEELIDPIGDFERTRTILEEHRNIGIDTIAVRLFATGHSHYKEQLDAAIQLAADLD